jgi:hypothetical protein
LGGEAELVMSLTDLANIGEFLGAVGVIVSLVYLAVQIRQNTTSQKATATRSAIDSISRLEEMLVQDRSVVEILGVGLREPAKLDEVDQVRLDVFLSSVFARYEAVFLQARSSLVSIELWQSHEARMLELLATTGGRAWWGRRESTLSLEFRTHVEGKLATAGGSND